MKVLHFNLDRNKRFVYAKHDMEQNLRLEKKRTNGKSKYFPNLDFLTLPCSTVLFTPVKVEHGEHRRYNETEPSELLFPGISVAILDHECLLCCLTFMT